jgi:hypothetical protein
VGYGLTPLRGFENQNLKIAAFEKRRAVRKSLLFPQAAKPRAESASRQVPFVGAKARDLQALSEVTFALV